MLIVYIPGVWDLLHVGHIEILEKAKSLGDKLIVGVPTDEVVRQDKGELPIISLGDRVRMLEALKCVDTAVAYNRLDFLDHLEKFKPDIFVVGDSWGKEDRHVRAEIWIRMRNKKMVKFPRYQNESTTSIKARVLKELL